MKKENFSNLCNMLLNEAVKGKIVDKHSVRSKSLSDYNKVVLKTPDKMDANSDEFIQLYLIYLVMKGFVKEVKSSEMYKLGLINEKGEIQKLPDTKKERDAFNLFDAYMFNLQHVFRNKKSEMTKYRTLIPQNMLDDFEKRIRLTGVVNNNYLKQAKRILDKDINSNNIDIN